MGFGEAIGSFYKNYLNFQGRASRAEYWWPVLMQLIIYAALVVLFFGAFGTDGLETNDEVEVGAAIVLLIGLSFYLINFLPSISVKVRRFHDLDQTGWLVLVFWVVNFFVPLAEFARMIWFAFPGKDGSNRYGSNPNGNEAEVFG